MLPRSCRFRGDVDRKAGDLWGWQPGERVARAVLALVCVVAAAALVALAPAGCDRVGDPSGGLEGVRAGINTLAADRDRLLAENDRLRWDLLCCKPCVETCHPKPGDGILCVKDCPRLGCPRGAATDGGAR